MKADFTSLFPTNFKGGEKAESNNSLVKQPSESEDGESNTHVHCHYNSNYSTTKWLVVTMLVFFVGVTVVMTAFIVKYEDKLARHEDRVAGLEASLNQFKKQIQSDQEEELEYETHGDLMTEGSSSLFAYEEDSSSSEEEDDILNSSHNKVPKAFEGEGEESLEEILIKVGEEDEGNGEYGKIVEKDVKRRHKRQVQFPSVPTFGPEVERTKDGVPIVEESYRTSAGVTFQPYARRVSTPSSSSQTTEGFKHYDRLGGGERGASRQQNYPPVQPHHQVSAAWTEPSSSPSQTRPSRSRPQVRSGDYLSDDDTHHWRPSSSEPRRTQSSHSRSSSSNNPFASNVVNTGGSSSGATYHRNSRVPATPEHQNYPSTTKSSFLHRESDDDSNRVFYPPTRKLRVGNDEGEVIARVLQSEPESENETEPGGRTSYANANLGQAGTAEASSSRHRVYGRRRPNNNNQNQNPGSITSHAQTQSFTSYGRNNNGESRRRYSTAPRNKGQFLHSYEDEDDDFGGGEVSVVKAEAFVEGPPQPLAAHYVADVSNYTTAHRHYDGNGRLRNADGIFEAWRPADWMTQDDTKNFALSREGALTVKKPGLYYIYAQIHYLDEHDINGFVLQVNGSPFLQCTIMSETYGPGAKSNSCFTAGVHSLKEGDRVLIKDVETNRYSIFKPEKSFFGLMRIAGSP